MEPVLECCAGMDVHEKKVDVCIAHGSLDKSPKFEIRTFSTMTSDLEELGRDGGCIDMLEDHFHIKLSHINKTQSVFG